MNWRRRASSRCMSSMMGCNSRNSSSSRNRNSRNSCNYKNSSNNYLDRRCRKTYRSMRRTTCSSRSKNRSMSKSSMNTTESDSSRSVRV